MATHTLRSIVQQATLLMAEVTDLEPVEVTGIAKDEKGWLLHIEMLEYKKIPPAGDVIAEYEVQLDGEGELLSFRRVRSRLRSETVSDEAG